MSDNLECLLRIIIGAVLCIVGLLLASVLVGEALAVSDAPVRQTFINGLFVAAGGLLAAGGGILAARMDLRARAKASAASEQKKRRGVERALTLECFWLQASCREIIKHAEEVDEMTWHRAVTIYEPPAVPDIFRMGWAEMALLDLDVLLQVLEIRNVLDTYHSTYQTLVVDEDVEGVAPKRRFEFANISLQRIDTATTEIVDMLAPASASDADKSVETQRRCLRNEA